MGYIGSLSPKKKLVVLVHSCDLSFWEVGAGGSDV